MGGAAPRGLSGRAATRRTLAPLVAALALFARPVQGYGLIGLDPDLKSFPLQASEFSRLDIRAGWVEGAPERMVFEIRNGLSVPVHCASVQIDHRERGKLVLGLEPAVWVPSNQSRRSGARPLRKDDVKRFSLVCSCLRRSERGACEAPLKP
ncbi:MAG: hypothetical protein FJY25_14665 [Betaproteobacteria bacterium]|nr:hypothetical protein [Betaproteobacteria bacterium]